MVTYIARRLATSTLVLFIVSIMVFLMVRAAPGDVVLAKLRGRIPESDLAAIRDRLGLQDPLYEQYWIWIKGVVTLDLGNSLYFEHLEVMDRIGDALPVTAELIAIAILASLAIGVPIGILSAVKQGTLIDLLARVFSVTGLALPLFWLGTLAVIYSAKWTGYSFAVSEYVPIWEDPVENIKQFWLPGLLLGYNLSSVTMRVVRSAVLDVLRQDYVRTARAKGLAEHVVISRHVMKNAMIPVVTIIGNQLVFLLGGTLVVESVFHLPGLGRSALDAIATRDYTMIQGVVLIMAAITILANLVVDISYAWLDPRIKYS